MTTSYSASSSGQGRPIIRSGGPADSRDGGHGGHDQPRGASSITLVAPPGRRGAGRSPPPTPVWSSSWLAHPRPHRTARRRRPSTLAVVVVDPVDGPPGRPPDPLAPRQRRRRSRTEG